MSIVNIQIDKNEVIGILHEISRKLLLIEGERKAAKRREIINSVLDENGCEIVRLKKLLGIVG